MNKKLKLNLRLIVAALLAIIGSGLLIAGFIVPPLGIIDSSILVAFGETSTFVAAVLGIDYNYNYEMYLRTEGYRKIENDDDEII